MQVHCICNGLGFPLGTASTQRIMLLGRALQESGTPFHVWHIGTSFIPGNTLKKGARDGVTWEYLSPAIDRPDNRLIRYFYFLYGALQLPLRLWPARKNAKVLLYSDGGLLHLWMIACCRMLGIPTAQECCEWWPGTPRQTLLNRWMYRSVIFRWSQGALPISRLIETRIRRSAKAGYPILRIPILVDPAEVMREKERAPQTPGSDQPYLFWCGVLDSYLPDALFLVRVLGCLSRGRINPPRLVLAGPCGEKTREALAEESAKAGLADGQLILTGFIEESEVFRLATHAQLSLLPLWDDDRSQSRFPTKLGLYAAAGRPVVASPIGEIPHFLEDDETALFAAGDEAAWSRTILRLLEEEGLARKIAVGMEKKFLPQVEFRNFGPSLKSWFENLG